MTLLGIDGITDEVEIGRGSNGVVYRATQEAFGRTVAVKVLLGTFDEGAVRRFRRECEAIGSLSDVPGIVDVHFAGQLPSGSPFLVMSHLSGGSLADEVAAGPLPPERVRTVGVRIARALAGAHDRGVLHLDVKPANVLVDDRRAVHLADFGISKLTHAATADGSWTTALTPAYAAPEVVAGATPTRAADLYSLGATLYCLAAGRPPFTAGAGGLLALFRQVAEDEPPPLDHLPAALAGVIGRAMAKNPADRFADSSALADALEAVGPLDGAAPATEDDTVTTVGAAASPVAAVSSSASAVDTATVALGHDPAGGEDRDPSEQGRLLRIGAGVVLVVAIALAGAVAVGSGGEDDPATVSGAIPVGAGALTPVEVGDALWVALNGEDALAVIDTDQRAVVARVVVGSTPFTPAVLDDELWVRSITDDTVTPVDAVTRVAGDPIAVGVEPRAPLVTTDRVWVPNSGDGTLTVIDRAARRVEATVEVGAVPFTPVASENHVWIPLSGDDAVAVVDRATLELVDTVAVGAGPRRGVVAGGRVWIPLSGASSVVAIDTASRAVVATVDVGEGPSSPLLLDGRLWVSNAGSGTVSVVDVADAELAAVIGVGRDPFPPAAGDGLVVVANNGADTVTLIDAELAEVIDVVPTGAGPVTPAVTADAIWVPAFDGGEITVIDRSD